MKISETYKDFQLTQDQQKATALFEEFIDSDKKVFILKGYAGTGKTTLLKGYAKFLSGKSRLGRIVAPTGRAARVIESITGFESSTIHRLIYNMKKLKTEEIIGEDGKQTFKYFFEVSENLDDIRQVYFVDEASMVSNNYSDSEFFRFGSGYLLSDLLQYIDLFSNKKNKLVLVGDPAQLPPVGSKDSLALEPQFFISKELAVQSYELTEVVRQQEKSGILFNANRIRDLIFQTQRNQNIFNHQFEDVHILSSEAAISQYIQFAPLPNISKLIFIVFSNATVQDYNKQIRATYFPEQENITAGDILQITKNNYSDNAALFNGDFVDVLKVDTVVEKRVAPVFVNNKKEEIALYFRDVLIKYGDNKQVNIKLIDSLLHSRYRDLTAAETKALYIDFVIRFKKRNHSKFNTQSIEFKEALKNDLYFNAIRAKFGYAITGHKSQGGTWENVIVDFSGRTGLNADALRWSYTAITRASKRLFVLNAPHIKPIDFNNIEVNIGGLKKLPKGAISFPKAPATPFHNNDTFVAKRLKYFEIERHCFEHNLKIENVLSFPYQETYKIGISDELLTFDLWHNAEGIFTKTTCKSESEKAQQLRLLISTSIPDNVLVDYSPKNKLLQQLNDYIYAAIEDIGLNIVGIDDSKLDNYFVNYYFSGNQSQIAYIQCYFNKANRFTKLIAKSSLGANDQQLLKLINILKTSI